MTEEEMYATLTPRERGVLSYYDADYKVRHMSRVAARIPERIRKLTLKFIRPIIRAIPSELAPERKLRILYEAVTETCTYDHNEDHELRYSFLSILVRNDGVCQAYSEMMASFLTVMGVDAIEIVGGTRDVLGFDPKEQKPGHAWNMVKLRGNWYHFDITWDLNRPFHNYKYYLVSDATMFTNDHFWIPTIFPSAKCEYNSPPLDLKERLIKAKVKKIILGGRSDALCKL